MSYYASVCSVLLLLSVYSSFQPGNEARLFNDEPEYGSLFANSPLVDQADAYLVLPDSNEVYEKNPIAMESLIRNANNEMEKNNDYLRQLQSLPRLRDVISHKMDGISLERDQNGADTLSEPVNKPEDFFGTWTIPKGAFSLKDSGTSNRSELTDDLISAFINALIEKQATDLARDENQDNNDISAETERNSGGEMSASRYGTGEYIDHPLALVGHQYMQGGAGEGRQLLGPDGSFENVQVIKSDHAVPSYCNPPNPCPIGYTSEDGCLEEFVNSASFSREYQAKQQCSCDNEHSLFNCASPISTIKTSEGSSVGQGQQQEDSNTEPANGNDEEGISYNSIRLFPINSDDQRQQDKLETLARTIQNRFGSLDSVQNLLSKYGNYPSQAERSFTVAKKAPKLESNFRY